MTSLRLSSLGLALALLAAPAWMPPAQAAGQRPTEGEAARIAQVLGAQGYRDWGRVEMDDGLWEVDDAMDAQGGRHDLRLTPGDFRLIARGGGDRLANIEEAARIGEVLKAQGFQSFASAKLDDGVWEVDDAVMADGSRFDLTLEPGDYRILHREREG